MDLARSGAPPPVAPSTLGVLFGDMCSGFIRAARVDGSGKVIENRHVGHLEGPVSWQQASDGTLTVATYGDCLNERETPTGAFYRAVPVWPEDS